MENNHLTNVLPVMMGKQRVTNYVQTIHITERLHPILNKNQENFNKNFVIKVNLIKTFEQIAEES